MTATTAPAACYTYGIPGFKLEKDVVMRRVDRLVEGGIHFHLGISRSARTRRSKQLRQKHDAILIATGVLQGARDQRARATAPDGVIAALDYLIASNRKGFGDAVPAFDDGRLDAQGQECRRHRRWRHRNGLRPHCGPAGREPARGRQCRGRRRRVRLALGRPKASPPTGHVKDVKAVAGMRLGAPDASGRRSPEADPGAAFDVPADMVIKALGFDPEELPHLFGSPDLSVYPLGHVARRSPDDDVNQFDGGFRGRRHRPAVPAWSSGASVMAAMSASRWQRRKYHDAHVQIDPARGSCSAAAAGRAGPCRPEEAPVAEVVVAAPRPKKNPRATSTAKPMPTAKGEDAEGNGRSGREKNERAACRRSSRRVWRSRKKKGAPNPAGSLEKMIDNLSARCSRRYGRVRWPVRPVALIQAGVESDQIAKLDEATKGKVADMFDPHRKEREDQITRPPRAAQPPRRRHGLPAAHRSGRAGGMPHDRRKRDHRRGLYTIYGWRQVPVDVSVIGDKAQATRPEIEQIMIAGPLPDQQSAAEFEKQLYLVRRRIEKKVIVAAQIADFYICSLSCALDHLQGPVPRREPCRLLSRPHGRALRQAALRSFHQRYSTNTFPQWWLAQPFRCLAHNGEINTIRGNKNWMKSHEIKMASLAFGEHSEGHQTGDPGGRIRHRRARRRVRGDLPLRPRRADRQADAGARSVEDRMRCPHNHRAMYSYLASVMEPWDGPAALAMTDGRWAVAGMDRNALRPLRYTLTADNLLVVGSESRHGAAARGEHPSRRAASAPGR
ncbi:Glutamate synthase large subunit [Aphelenchoides bicaudatus]|nr:Glutamate synthase large subunit [Aphelenchoides bicaudatus]